MRVGSCAGRVQSRPVGSSVSSGRRRSRVEHRRLDRLASYEVSLFWFGTLLGPEGTAVWLSSSVPDLLRVPYRVAAATAGGVQVVGGEPVGV